MANPIVPTSFADPVAVRQELTQEVLGYIQAGVDAEVLPLHGEMPPAEQDRAAAVLDRVRDDFPPGCGRHHFFPSRSFSAALSSIASASSRFSRVFSCSSALISRRSPPSRGSGRRWSRWFDPRGRRRRTRPPGRG